MYTIVTFTERPDLFEPADQLVWDVWPEFMLNDPVANRHWDRMCHEYADYQFLLMEGNTMIAYGNSIPFHWSGADADLPDAGWDWELEIGMNPTQPANVLGALSITIAKDYQGKGISQEVVKTMKEIGKQHGLTALYAPVRPNQKSRYPLIPMERYITWKNADGQPFDPWIRVHARLGAQIVKICPQSMIITNTVQQWEAWTKMRLPDTGSYVIPGGLVPLEINADQGTYIEPNVWMRHEIGV